MAASQRMSKVCVLDQEDKADLSGAPSKTSEAVGRGSKVTARRGVLPLATAGNYSHLLANMDTRVNRQKKKLTSLRTSPMKFMSEESGQAMKPEKSGARQSSASSRSSNKVIFPALKDRSNNHVPNGNGGPVAVETVAGATAAPETVMKVKGSVSVAAPLPPVKSKDMVAMETGVNEVVSVGKCKDTVAVERSGADNMQTKEDKNSVKDSEKGPQENGANGAGTKKTAGTKSVEEGGDDREEEEAAMSGKTEEELEAELQKLLDNLSQLYKSTASMLQVGEDGLYIKDFLKKLESVRMSYYKFKKYPLKLMRKGRQEAGRLMVESGVMPILFDILIFGLETRNYFSQEGELVRGPYNRLRNTFVAVLNFSDASDEVTYAVRDHERLLPLLLSKIRDWHSPHMDGSLGNVEEYLLKNCMSVIHNTAMREDNVECMRQLGASDALLPYLETTKEAYKLSAVASLADIATEEEADKLAATPETAHFLLNRLKRALKDRTHRFQGWSVTELVRAVRQLARNDANKRLMVEEGAIPLLSQGVQAPKLEAEKTECFQCLWMLCFCKENWGEILKDEPLLDQIVAAYHDHSVDRMCRRSAQGILWLLREELEKMEKYSHIGKAFQTRPHADTLSRSEVSEKVLATGGPIKKGPTGHVMLSYQWANQELVKTIRDYLRVENFTVWMDIDNMGGSTLQAMAEAIEGAFVVIICMTQKYKDSPNCRAEAEYAFQKRKKIIPLILQHGYRPDGWLGMILGAKLYYDFSQENRFNERITALLKAVHEVAKELGVQDKVDGPATQVTAAVPVVAKSSVTVSYSSPPDPAKPPVDTGKIQAWGRDDVRAWLKKHGLDGTELERLTGKEIIFLHNLRGEAPEYFYSTLERKLHIETLSGLISFTDALGNLPRS